MNNENNTNLCDKFIHSYLSYANIELVPGTILLLFLVGKATINYARLQQKKYS